MFVITLMAMSSMEKEEEEFFVGLYRDYFTVMQRQAQKIVKDWNLAEDMVHETFIRLFGSVGKLMGMTRKAAVSYLLVSVRRTSINYIVKKGNAEMNQSLSYEEEEYAAAQDWRLYIDERQNLTEVTEDMAEAILTLPQKYQDVLNFKYLLGMSDEEIGQLLNISKNSVRQYLTRARRKALEAYEDGKERR